MDGVGAGDAASEENEADVDVEAGGSAGVAAVTTGDARVSAWRGVAEATGGGSFEASATRGGASVGRRLHFVL